MSYNWTSASTPQGRERLKELADSGKTVFVQLKGRQGLFYNVLAKIPNLFGREEKYNMLQQLDNVSKPFDWFIELDIEFLDPSPKQQPDENGLLPCPFCGGKAAVGEHYLPYSRFITNCQSCEAESSIFTTARLAIAAWNKRA